MLGPRSWTDNSPQWAATVPSHPDAMPRRTRHSTDEGESCSTDEGVPRPAGRKEYHAPLWTLFLAGSVAGKIEHWTATRPGGCES